MPRSAPTPKPNRSDLRQPISSAPGQPYGMRAEQQAAQRAIPMAAAPMNAQAPTAPQTPPPAMAAAQAQGAALPPVTPLTAPTERPNEPPTAGLPTGPGPGPEALQGLGQVATQNTADQGTVANLLQSLANAPGATAAVRDLAARAMSGVQ